MSVAVQSIESEADVRATMRAIGGEARAATRVLAIAPTETKNRALFDAARSLRERFGGNSRRQRPRPRRGPGEGHLPPHSSIGSC